MISTATQEAINRSRQSFFNHMAVARKTYKQEVRKVVKTIEMRKISELRESLKN